MPDAVGAGVSPPVRPLSRRELLAHLGSLAALALGVEACGSRAKSPQSEGNAELGPIEKELNLYIWSDYLAEDTIPNFEREFGVSVTLDTYENNEEMVAKLLAGASGYDVVVPSSYIFPVLFARDLLAPIRRDYLSNWGNVAPLFVDPLWDPGSTHSVGYAWGYTGIAYRRDLVDPAPDSWGVFHDARYRGKLTLLDDLRDVIGSFLKFRGHSINSTDPAALARAKTDVLVAKPNVKAFIAAAVKSQLIAGDVWIAQMWNGDAAQAAAEQPTIDFVLPKEGSQIFADAMVIPRSAPHRRAAHEWINYVLRPEVGAAIADKTGYGTANQAAVPLTRAKLNFPSGEELARLEYVKDLGPALELWDRIWTEIKAG